jgi:hypothetical protein
MKKVILILLVLGLGYKTDAQARLGDTEWEIREEFSEKTFTSGYSKDGDKWLMMETSLSTVGYYFGKESDWKCYMTIVIPDNQTALNTLVEKYNREYVIISETEWKMYGNNGIMKISLIFAEEGGYYFLMR